MMPAMAIDTLLLSGDGRAERTELAWPRAFICYSREQTELSLQGQLSVPCSQSIPTDDKIDNVTKGLPNPFTGDSIFEKSFMKNSIKVVPGKAEKEIFL